MVTPLMHAECTEWCRVPPAHFKLRRSHPTFKDEYIYSISGAHIITLLLSLCLHLKTSFYLQKAQVVWRSDSELIAFDTESWYYLYTCNSNSFLCRSHLTVSWKERLVKVKEDEDGQVPRVLDLCWTCCFDYRWKHCWLEQQERLTVL